MAKIYPFELHPLRYEKWFDDNRIVYHSELLAVKRALPQAGTGIEIGAGSGRFALPAGIIIGIEPSGKMAEAAVKNGMMIIRGIAESLPLKNECFDFALMVTTVCFLDDVEKAFDEAFRILRKNGKIIIGFIDKNSDTGRSYLGKKDKSLFYKDAVFYTADDIINYLTGAGFKDFSCLQTVFKPLEEIRAVEPVREGRGKGSFVVVSGSKL